MQTETVAASTTLPWTNWHGTYAMNQKFDRLMFDPAGNGTHAAILRRLRSHGRKRRWWYGLRGDKGRFHHPTHDNCCCSPALRALRLYGRPPGAYVDLGCGDSADAAVAREWGHHAVGVDLYPPDTQDVRPEDLTQFLPGDVASWIPFPDGSVSYATSQAMIDLIEPEARPKFYAEVRRVLAPDGLFALNGVRLANGYGYQAFMERWLCFDSGLDYVGTDRGAMIFKKP